MRKRLLWAFDGASFHQVEMTSAQLYSSSSVEKLRSCDICDRQDPWRPAGKVMTCWTCLLALHKLIGNNMDDKRLPLVAAANGNFDNAPTMVTRAALTLWYIYSHNLNFLYQLNLSGVCTLSLICTIPQLAHLNSSAATWWQLVFILGANTT